MTLSTSDTKFASRAYLAAIVFCLIFAAIYEHFSHGVTSYYMILSFLIPLCGWILTEGYAKLLREKQKKNDLIPQILAGGILWLTLGSIFQGILEIYGTTNQLSRGFLILGMAQVILSLLLALRLLKDE